MNVSFATRLVQVSARPRPRVKRSCSHSGLFYLYRDPVPRRWRLSLLRFSSQRTPLPSHDQRLHIAQRLVPIGTRHTLTEGSEQAPSFPKGKYVLSLVLPSAHARSLNHRRVKSSSLLTSTDKVRPDPFRRRFTS